MIDTEPARIAYPASALELPDPPRPTLRERIEANNPIAPTWRPWAIALGLMVTATATDTTPAFVVPLATLTAGAALFGWDSLHHRGAALSDRAVRLRRKLLLVGSYGGWMSGAAFVDWQAASGGVAVLTGGLLVGTAARHVQLHGWPHRAAREPLPLAITQHPAENPHDAMVRELQARWARMSESNRSGVMRGTSLNGDPVPVFSNGRSVGWRGTFELGDESNVDTIENGIGQVARVYKTGKTLVSITLDQYDASQAHVVVLKTNTLQAELAWDGAGIHPDGRAIVGRYMGGSDVVYRFWDGGGVWHDLIAGTTGSGKSEFVNLLLAMEIRHPRAADGRPLIVSYLIDPQAGQSYAEITDFLGGFASDVNGARALAGQLEAEMLRRNGVLHQMRWIDHKGRKRRGIKTWRPTADMPMLSLTVDEAHTYLMADDAFRECIARIVAMGRKCGIRVRLITQVPLLSSLGKQEIRDAVAAGNVMVLRTGGSLTGQVAANGRLPGKPELLPRLWPDGTSAAGLAYSVGAEAVSELCRLLFAGDTFDWLADDDGQYLYEAADYELPEAYVPEDLTEAQISAQTDSAGMTTRDRVAAFVREHPGEWISTADILAATKASARSVAYALADLITPKWGNVLRQRDGGGAYMLNEGGEITSHL